MNAEDALLALSPVDGRYASTVEALRPYGSEFGLIRARVRVEIAWFLALCDSNEIAELTPLSSSERAAVQAIATSFQVADALEIKSLERTTNHDVKAVEYFVKARMDALGLGSRTEFVHFACTSEDINNLSYALMVTEALHEALRPVIDTLIAQVKELAHEHADVPMLSRTHGQTASPTTLGKEMANFCDRLERALISVFNVQPRGKANGAVGNYNAHLAAYPSVNWPAFTKSFVEDLGLQWSAYTTQIEPHDWMAELFDAISRLNTIIVDMNRDIWGYISLGYFGQRTVDGEIGSSTMPHKVNPIDFENGEGNAELATALLTFLARRLPVSRWQRDLTDSTLQRNIGMAFGYTLIAWTATSRGLRKLQANPERLAADLDRAWEVMAEPIQTVMRRYGVPHAYEKLKALTRGRAITEAMMRSFVDELDIPGDAKNALLALTPHAYTGFAAHLAKDV